MYQVMPPSFPLLALDHDLVLSAWEEIGGDIYTCGEFFASAAITLDLSGIEESLKQSSRASLDHLANVSVVPNLFPSIPDLNMPSFGMSTGMLGGLQPAEKQSCWTSHPQCFQTTSPISTNNEAAVELSSHDQQGAGATSSMSSNSADVAVVPEVSSHPAYYEMQCSPVAKVPQQSFMPNLLVPIPPGGTNAMRPPSEAEAWRTRRECLERYKEKKARRMYTKKIRYQLRKINADKRPRIKGRFVKKEELDEYMKVDVPFAGKLEDDCCSDDIDEEEDSLSDKESGSLEL